jgi:hypothetical protein
MTNVDERKQSENHNNFKPSPTAAKTSDLALVQYEDKENDHVFMTYNDFYSP